MLKVLDMKQCQWDVVAEEAKVKLIVAWMNTSGVGQDTRDDRTGYIHLLLPILDLNNLTQDFMLDVALKRSDLKLSSLHRQVLVDA